MWDWGWGAYTQASIEGKLRLTPQKNPLNVHESSGHGFRLCEEHAPAHRNTVELQETAANCPATLPHTKWYAAIKAESGHFLGRNIISEKGHSVNRSEQQ